MCKVYLITDQSNTGPTNIRPTAVQERVAPGPTITSLTVGPTRGYSSI
ncbi:uncharacterized protein FPRN_15253 [Fusarium proliferatum]|nr:uncharacterized protein FPRN_15253 [Fusarium proliferatum]